MVDLKLSFAMTPYDRVLPLISGEVKPDGVALEYVGQFSMVQMFEFEMFVKGHRTGDEYSNLAYLNTIRLLISLEPTRHAHPNEQRIAVVIPAFNEEGRVGHVVEAIPREIVDDIIVVDDHSTDATSEESIMNGATHVASCPSRGVGAAIKTGYWEALKRGADVLVVVAGDSQHDPREIPRILEPALNGNADYVVGDRLNSSLRETDMTAFRYVGNQMLSLLTRMLTGLKVKDSVIPACNHVIMQFLSSSYI